VPPLVQAASRASLYPRLVAPQVLENASAQTLLDELRPDGRQLGKSFGSRFAAATLSRWVAETFDIATTGLRPDLLGFKRCEIVLRYGREWRRVYATPSSGRARSLACRLAGTPDSVQRTTPNNLQSDSDALRIEVLQQRVIKDIITRMEATSDGGDRWQ
jgi:hypothetical protein